RAEADVLAHRPEPLAVHVRVDAAGERILARPADVALDVHARRVLRPVDRLDRKARVRSQLFHESSFGSLASRPAEPRPREALSSPGGSLASRLAEPSSVRGPAS